jgi:plasmid stability protein
MPKSLQVRGLDDDVIAELKARAAVEGMSLSAYVKRLLVKEAEKP